MRAALASLAVLAACAIHAPLPAPPGSGAAPAGEARVLDRVNAARREAGCAPLAWSDAAGRVAAAHSADMARRGYFSHVSPEGTGPGERLRAAGIAWSRVAENIAHTGGGAEDAARIWLASAGHRANIVNCAYTHSGVGHAAGRWTQVFYTPAGT